MTITFEQDKDSHYALALNAVYNNQECEELLFAEIISSISNNMYVVWEDNWQVKEPMESLDAAKLHILNNYKKHKPYINGKTFDI